MAKKAAPKFSPLRLGNAVFIRTVTMYCTGRIVSFSPEEIVLDEAAWIADTGRFADALKTGKLNEVEPFPDLVSVNRGTVVDVTSWTHELPREQR